MTHHPGAGHGTVEQQVLRYLELGVHDLAGLSEQEFRERALRLAAAASGAASTTGAGGGAAGEGHTPLLVSTDEGPTPLLVSAGEGPTPLLAIHPDLVPAAALAPLLERDGKAGFVVEDLTDLAEFTPIDGIDLPAGPFYLVTDLQRGDEMRNLSPTEALPRLAAAGRTPLTVGEANCWLLQEPQQLAPNHCFMCIGSRRPKARGGLDSRTPALWISGGTGRDGKERRGAPKVGWCWANNRHTWMGFASAAGRGGTAGTAG